MENIFNQNQASTAHEKVPEIKEGVDFVFEQNSELAEIGTKEQYSQYLDTIFPKSKVKDIVYHSSPSKIKSYKESIFGTYFAYSPIRNTYGNIINCAILNSENPLVIPNKEDNVKIKETYNKNYRNYNNPISFLSDGLPIYTFDASIESSTVTKEGVQIRVRNPDQIHILGSEHDIEQFKMFIKNSKEN